MGLFRKPKKKARRRDPSLFDDQAHEEALPPQKRKIKPKKRSGFLRVIKLVFVLGFWSAFAASLGLVYIWFTLDQRGLLEIPAREPGVMIIAKDGTVLAEHGSFFGDAAKIQDLPDYVPNAIIAIEDHRFKGHYGIDPIGLARAFTRNLSSGRMVQGGSTLTQQLAKNLFLSPERTFSRKAQEAVLAIWLETKFSKEEILQLYLNRVYFGSGATGIEKAANEFFGKSASDLTVYEAAKLAAVLKAPTTYNPRNHPNDNATRAKLVLAAMVREGFISASDGLDALDEADLAKRAATAPPKKYVTDWILAQVPDLIKTSKEPLVIQTTIDTTIQSSAEISLRSRLQKQGEKLKVSQGAVVVLAPDGAVTAMVGGKSYAKSQFNRASKAKRQPGSTFKAFVYLTAIEQGFRPSSIAVDEPVRFGKWSPENHKGKYLGEVSLQKAYAQSINTVAAKIAVAVGPSAVVQTAENLGITSPLNAEASIALGTSEVTPLELTRAFTPFANGGIAIEPYVIANIATQKGKLLFERKSEGLGQVISTAALGQMNQLMRATLREGTGKAAQFGNLDIGGKTGTSQNYRDAWFVGYTPHLITGVWMGNDDNSPTKQVTGGTLPAQVWRDIMEPAHKNLEWQALPGEPEALPSEGEIAAMEESQTEPKEQTIIEPESAPRTILDLLFGNNEEAVEESLY